MRGNFMKIKTGFVLEEVAGRYLACATGDLVCEFSGLVTLNSTGAFLWNLLSEGDTSEEAMLERMLSEYDVSEDIARRDIELFVKKLRDGGILDE